MPWMLQPKSYTQIARPNLYNVAYRRVGAYKGMGRLHPTNYLEIGVRPNRIGATTGQYNTLSGQLSLLPPSLRGFGQVGPASISPSGIPLYSSTVTSQSASGPLFTCPTGEQVFSSSQCPGGAPAPDVQQQIADIWSQIFGSQPSPAGPTTSTMQTWLPWAIGGALLLVLLVRR